MASRNRNLNNELVLQGVLITVTNAATEAVAFNPDLSTAMNERC